jgi:hypothetical protein
MSEALDELKKLLATYPTYFQLGKWVVKHRDAILAALARTD